MKMLLFFLFFPFVLNAQNQLSIDFTKAKYEITNAEKIFKDFEIVSLETHKDALLNSRATYYLTDKYIIAVSFLTGAYLFDRKTGAFIREVGLFGQGPNEYSGWIYNLSGFDETNSILFASDGPSIKGVWKGFNIESNKIESVIKKPVSKDNSDGFRVTAPWFIKDDIYISFINNISGNDTVKLVVFNRDGQVIQKYPNYLTYKRENKMTYPANNGIFYYYKGLSYFKEWEYNDTIYCVTENQILPHIIFKLGDKQPSYYHQDDIDYNKGKYLIHFVYESDLFVLFNFTSYTGINVVSGIKSGETKSHTGYYDKRNKQVYISSTPDLKQAGYTISGIPVPFYPIYINKGKEMIAHINPEELIIHEDKISKKYKALFQDIQEDDNPIIIIAKLKD